MYDIKSIQNQVQQVQLESKKTLSSANDIVKVTVNGTYQIVELVLDYKQGEFVDLEYVLDL
jgi:DNA-binding protein YbaB